MLYGTGKLYVTFVYQFLQVTITKNIQYVIFITRTETHLCWLHSKTHLKFANSHHTGYIRPFIRNDNNAGKARRSTN